MPSTPSQNQGEMIVGSQMAGVEQAVDFSDRLANNRMERDLHVLSALTDLAQAKMREGLLSGGRSAAESHYGDAAPVVLSGADRIKGELHTSAEEHFKKAERYDEMDAAVKAGVWVVDTLHKHPYGIHRSLYSDFLKKYYLPSDSFAARRDYRKQLLAEIDELRSYSNSDDSSNIETIVGTFNRKNGLRPYSSDPNDLEDIGGMSERELPDLNTRQRLEAFLHDPRAGFVPKFRPELNQMLSWLDYMDGTETSGSINDQLEEVFIRGCYPTRKSNKKGPYLGEEFGVRAVESNAWAVGDYLLENQARLEAMQGFEEHVRAQGSPRMKLYEILKVEDPGEYSDDKILEGLLGRHWFAAAALVQYLDIMEYIETGEVKGLSRNPLRITEDPPKSARPDFSAVPGKRKTVYNQYTAPGVADETGEYATHILVRLKQLSVKDARKLIPDCVEDLQKENVFIRRRMNELAKFNKGPYKPVRDAVYTVRDQLQAAVA